jgi:serine/threonine-protein kinase
VASTDPFGLVGQVLDSQFRVDDYVGEGGFSIVYKGISVGLNEPIAIKCLKLPPSLGSVLVESFVRRFRDESRIHYKLSQANLHVVRSIASGTTIAPSTSALVPYTVLEWLEGKSLADDFAERRQRGLQGRTLAETVKLLDSAVDAVAYAHSQGVVHRDLNPGNLFLAKTATGIKLKVLDFGVAKILADSALAMGPTMRTVGNIRMFAPAYGAPEQFDENVGAIGPWTDVYAVALVLMEALRDHTVMEGEHIGEFAMKALDPNARPTPRALGIAVGDLVEEVLSMAVTIDPKERPRDAGHLWGMLKHAMKTDEKSGRKPHARSQRITSEPPAPNTLRIHPKVPEGPASPVIEVIRPPSNAPPPGLSTTPVPVIGARPLSGTLRMPGRPRSAVEALARTPVPPSVIVAGQPAMVHESSGVLPTPLPSHVPSAPPPSSTIAPSTTPSRAPAALWVLLVLVLLGALAAAAWVLVGRVRHVDRPTVHAVWC